MPKETTFEPQHKLLLGSSSWWVKQVLWCLRPANTFLGYFRWCHWENLILSLSWC